MPRAIWKDTVLAEAPAERVEVVEGNVYFPADTLVTKLFQPSTTHTVCPWKGTASYYNVVVAGATNADAAWFYPAPKDTAKQIAGFVAFWRGVKIEV